MSSIKFLKAILVILFMVPVHCFEASWFEKLPIMSETWPVIQNSRAVDWNKNRLYSLIKIQSKVYLGINDANKTSQKIMLQLNDTRMDTSIQEYDCRLSYDNVNGALYLLCLRFISWFDFLITKVDTDGTITLIKRFIDTSQLYHFVHRIGHGPNSTFWVTFRIISSALHSRYITKRTNYPAYSNLTRVLYFNSDCEQMWERTYSAAVIIAAVSNNSNYLLVTQNVGLRLLDYSTGNQIGIYMKNNVQSGFAALDVVSDFHRRIFILWNDNQSRMSTYILEQITFCKNGRTASINSRIFPGVKFSFAYVVPNSNLLVETAYQSGWQLEELDDDLMTISQLSIPKPLDTVAYFLPSVGLQSVFLTFGATESTLIDGTQIDADAVYMALFRTSAYHSQNNFSSYCVEPPTVTEIPPPAPRVPDIGSAGGMGIVGIMGIIVGTIVFFISFGILSYRWNKYLMNSWDYDRNKGSTSDVNVSTPPSSSPNSTTACQSVAISETYSFEVNLDLFVKLRKKLLETAHCQVYSADILNDQMANQERTRDAIVKISTTTSREDFAHEAQIHRLFRNKIYFSQIYGYDIECKAICMKYYQKGSLAQWIRDTNSMLPYYSSAIVFSFASDIVNAIKTMHDMSIMHGDIKPDNILLDQIDGTFYRAVITDFGSAKNLNDKNNLFNASYCRKLHATPMYAAPEVLCQVFNVNDYAIQDCSPEAFKSSDIYSYGMTIHEMISRESPYHFERDMSKIVELVISGFIPVIDQQRDHELKGDLLLQFLIKLIPRCCIQSPRLRLTAEQILTEFKSQK